LESTPYSNRRIQMIASYARPWNCTRCLVRLGKKIEFFLIIEFLELVFKNALGRPGHFLIPTHPKRINLVL